MTPNTRSLLFLPLTLAAFCADAWSQSPASGLRLYAGSRTKNVRLVDNTGSVVQNWRTQFYSRGIDLMSDGTLIRGIYDPGTGPARTIGGAAGGVQRHAIDGRLLWDYRHNQSGVLSHHDIEPLPNGNVLLIVWEEKTAAEAIAQGREPSLLATPFFLPDSIVEVRPTGPTTGTVVWEWHVWDHLIQDFDNTKANFGVVGNHPELVDINYPRVAEPTGQFNHCNSVDYDPIHDWILVSNPKQDEIWIIDHSTTTAEAAGHIGGRWGKGGDLLWRWGNPRAYRAAPASAKQLVGQHSAQFVRSGYPGAGNVTVFNNHFGLRRSAVFELVLPLDPSGNFILTPGASYGPSGPVWTYSAPGFFSQIQSSAERLPNGDTLICSAEQDWLFEVTPSGQLTWQFTTGQGAPFQAHHTPRSLWSSTASLAAAQGGRVILDLRQGSASAGDTYLMLCSASGTTPGLTLFGVNVPLNFDPFFQASAAYPNTPPIFIQTFGSLNAQGSGVAAFTLPAGLPGGYQLNFAHIVLEPATLMLTTASNPVPLSFL